MRTTLGVRIRRAEEPDLDNVVGVLRAANAAFENVVPSEFFGAYLANVLDVRGRLHESELYLAERSDGAVVGAITIYPRASDEGWGLPAEWTGVRALAVVPSDRGLGIGRQLAESCVTRSRELGATTIALHTSSFMKAAMRLYAGIGFTRAPEFDRNAVMLVSAGSPTVEVEALAYKLELRGR